VQGGSTEEVLLGQTQRRSHSSPLVADSLFAMASPVARMAPRLPFDMWVDFTATATTTTNTRSDSRSSTPGSLPDLVPSLPDSTPALLVLPRLVGDFSVDVVLPVDAFPDLVPDSVHDLPMPNLPAGWPSPDSLPGLDHPDPGGWSSQEENEHQAAAGVESVEVGRADDDGYDSVPELLTSSPNSSLPGLLSDSSDSDHGPPGLASSSSDDASQVPGSVGRDRTSRRVRRAAPMSRQSVGPNLPRRYVPAYYRSAFIAPPIMDPYRLDRGLVPEYGDDGEGDETEDLADADLGTLAARRFQRDIASLIMPRRLSRSYALGRPVRQLDLGLRRTTYVIIFVSVTYW
jgi:hypothetical protein